MTDPLTLKELVEKHPDWADLPVYIEQDRIYFPPLLKPEDGKLILIPMDW